MRLAEAMRGFLLATSDRAYRNQRDQDAVREAEAALAEWDQTIASIRRTQARGTDAPGTHQDSPGRAEGQESAEAAQTQESRATGIVERSGTCDTLSQVTVKADGWALEGGE
jgi:hypothetical protein